ncbi:hypothetical protein ACGFIW_18850 [Micromonospora sp. NPDC048935]|uniref:hypothetical protein n=1 Tax=Micromonospora sp. NPDC048935 TaxID=3364262 RepID=UPI00371F70D8
MTDAATAVDRFADRVLRIHRDLSFSGLAEAIDGPPAFAATSPAGLTTLTVRGSQLPERYLWALYGFRLAQFLQRGWASRDLLYARALTAEPYTAAARDDYHTIVVERATGRFRGYGTLAASRDRASTGLAEPGRRRFVIETDYGIDLATFLGPQVTTDRVWEGKRLIRDYAMAPSAAAATVPWLVYLGWASVVASIFEANAVAVVGDAKKSGAIFQLELLGFAVETVDVAARDPAPDDLFGPLWDQPEQSRPFILRDSPDLRPTLRALGEVLAQDEPGSVRRRLEARIGRGVS